MTSRSAINPRWIWELHRPHVFLVILQSLLLPQKCYIVVILAPGSAYFSYSPLKYLSFTSFCFFRFLFFFVFLLFRSRLDSNSFAPLMGDLIGCSSPFPLADTLNARSLTSAFSKSARPVRLPLLTLPNERELKLYCQHKNHEVLC